MDLPQLFATQLQELAAAETLLLAALPALSQAAADTSLRSAFADNRTQAQKHAARLADASSSLRLPTQTTPCEPMAALLSGAAHAAGLSTPGILRDLALLTAAERIAHFEVASYSSTISLAKALGYGDAANLLVETLQDELKTVDHLKKLGKPLLQQAQQEASRSTP